MILKNRILNGLLMGFFPLLSLAATNEWSSDFAQGTTEYHVEDGSGNSLLISCPDGQPLPVSATVTMLGKDYHSPQHPSEMSFIIDGVTFDNPFDTSCNVCEDNFTHSFWPALLKANNLVVHANGHKVTFPTKNLSQELEPLDSPSNPCLTESQSF